VVRTVYSILRPSLQLPASDNFRSLTAVARGGFSVATLARAWIALSPTYARQRLDYAALPSGDGRSRFADLYDVSKGLAIDSAERRIA